MIQFEQITDGFKNILAIIIRKEFDNPGVTFFTHASYSQQLACINHKAGTEIEAHFHKPVERSVLYTQETLFIKRGLLVVSLYDDYMTYVANRILRAGDVILLISGGHGFEVLDDLEMVEVKQGPYTGDADKVRFSELSKIRETV